ncbi:myb-like protein X [Helianthus annuus]|uniref:myb-like protein X n=1 Tax=Helianthus annuus TaxID=4232 RepID=UPI000B8F786C|nr:myb-like protein X [Helianthus annuus]
MMVMMMNQERKSKEKKKKMKEKEEEEKEEEKTKEEEQKKEKNQKKYEFVQIVATTEQFADLETTTLDETIERLKAYEERTNLVDENLVDNQEKLMFTQRDKNYGRGSRFGNHGQGRFNSSQGKWRDEKFRQEERGRSISRDDSKNKDEGYDRRNRNPRDQNRFKKDMREVECYNCHEFGHYASQCQKAKQAQEESHLLEEDEEPTLLIAITEEESSETESDMKRELESWKFDMLQDFEIKKQEFETEMKNREIQFERQMHERETPFAEKMSIEIKKLKSESIQKHEVVRDIPSKDEPDIDIEDDTHVKDGDIQTCVNIKEFAHVQNKVCVAIVGESDQEVKQVTGRKPKFKDKDLLQQIREKDGEAHDGNQVTEKDPGANKEDQVEDEDFILLKNEDAKA